MIERGKRNLLGVQVDAVDYESAVQRIIGAAREGRAYSATALAVHGLVTGALDPEYRYRLNAFDLVTPDGQPVRWALNALYGTRLPDRVYGPTLTLELCDAAAAAALPVYLFGSSSRVVGKLAQKLRSRYPRLEIAGAEPSAFRRLDKAEHEALIARIRSSGAAMTFVGLGCPRQEVFVYESVTELHMPVLAVGAAFDYHSGGRAEPPAWAQRMGLQWAHRLAQDPKRLWKRYLVTNSQYLALFALQLTRAWRPSGAGSVPRENQLYG